jgi:hypothetical protein
VDLRICRKVNPSKIEIPRWDTVGPSPGSQVRFVGIGGNIKLVGVTDPGSPEKGGNIKRGNCAVFIVRLLFPGHGKKVFSRPFLQKGCGALGPQRTLYVFHQRFQLPVGPVPSGIVKCQTPARLFCRVGLSGNPGFGKLQKDTIALKSLSPATLRLVGLTEIVGRQSMIDVVRIVSLQIPQVIDALIRGIHQFKEAVNGNPMDRNGSDGYVGVGKKCPAVVLTGKARCALVLVHCAHQRQVVSVVRVFPESLHMAGKESDCAFIAGRTLDGTEGPLNGGISGYALGGFSLVIGKGQVGFPPELPKGRQPPQENYQKDDDYCMTKVNHQDYHIPVASHIAIRYNRRMNRRVIIGIALFIVGGTLLLVTTGVMTVGAIILPVLFLVVGIILFWRAFLPAKGDGNVFAGTFLVLTGGFSLLWESALPGVDVSTVWPVFMTITGIALAAYGIRKGNEYRFTLVTPGLALVILSIIFLLFSTDVIEVSLSRVASVWWPLVIILTGAFVLLYGSDRKDSDEEPTGDPELNEDLLPPMPRHRNSRNDRE